MNILMVADYFFPDEVGGSKRYIYDISKKLADRGYNIHVLVKRDQKDLLQEERIDNIVVHRYNVINPEISLFSHFSYIIGAFIAFNRLIRKIHFDLISFHHPLSAIGVNLSILSRNIPKIYTNHSLWVEELKIQLNFQKIAGLSFKKWPVIFLLWLTILESLLIEKINLHICRTILALSEYNKNKIAKIYSIPKLKIEVIPGGVDVNEFYPWDNVSYIRHKINIPENKFIIAAAGRLVFRKGFDNLIKAMPKITNKFKNKVYLLILGDGHLKKYLKDLTKKLNLENYVDFIGLVDNDDMSLYYRASDLFVMPSRAMEPFGLVILEALSSGIPVLGTPIGGIKEILSKFDRRLLFNGVDPASISKLIEHFIYSVSEYKEIKNKCRQHILENYSWDVVIERIENLYNKVVNW